MRATFPGVEPSPATDTPPAEVFRGNRCLACGRVLSDPESLASGIGPECGRTTTTRTSTWWPRTCQIWWSSICPSWRASMTGRWDRGRRRCPPRRRGQRDLEVSVDAL